MNETFTIVRPESFGGTSPLVAGLSTRIGGPADSPFGMNLSYNVGDDAERVTANRKRFFGALGIRLEDIATMQQVHSNAVVRVEHPGGYPSCDAMITDHSGIFLCVTVADCVPVFIMDRKVHALAVVHAGWRGSASRIVCAAGEALKDAFGAVPRRMEAYIGPSAGVCCYEVSKEVSDVFGADYTATRDFKHYVDLKGANRAQLMDFGVPASAIEVHPSCTIHEGATYHSFRRDGKLSGRMMGVAGFHAIGG